MSKRRAKVPKTDWLDKPANDVVPPLRDDQPFFLFTSQRGRKSWRWQDHKFALAYTAGAVVLLIGLDIAGVSPGLRAVSGLLMILIFGLRKERQERLQWQKAFTGQIEKLSGLHDRLVREVARGRGDMQLLKEGLAKTASRATAQRPNGTAVSAEARMIEAIVAQLSSLGQQPAATMAQHAAPDILELEINPPPRAPVEANAMESALTAPNGQRSEAMILRIIEQAVRNDAIDLFMQPVVSLPQRKLRMYETFTRLRAGDGLHIAASHYLETAQREKMAPAIDNLMLLRCLQMLRKTADETNAIPFVLNITGATLADAGFMGDLLTFLSDNRTMAARLVFELTQDEIESLPAATGPVLDGLVKLGCTFSMDGVRRRTLDLGVLRKRHIRYIKVDAAWLIREAGQRAGAARVLRFKQQLDSSGIDLIVERIENEDALRTILDFNIDFGQGYLFGKPDAASTWLARRSSV